MKKTYTLTWRHSPCFGSTLSRVHFNRSSLLWPWSLRYEYSPIIAFMHLCCLQPSSSLVPYRLFSCGLLVARSATYQGV